MKDIELREGGPPNTYDNTMITSYLKCPRSEYWFLRGLDYMRTPSYFVFGRALGAALNSWHLMENQEKPKDWRITTAQLAASKVWNSEPVEIFESRPNDTWESLVSTFHYYVEAYGDKEPWHQLKPEVGFRFPIPQTSLYYAGAIDSYVEWSPYGVLAREDKSTGAYITPGYMAQWYHVSQVTGYIWALHQLVEKPFGILMNVSSKRPRKDPLLRFSRELQTRSKWRTTEFIRETTRIADLIRREWDNWEWPKWGERNPYSCVGGPGLSPCLYKSLCLQEMLPWEMEEKYNFDDQFSWRKGSWKPWERAGSEGE
jgi:hypothetical protein